MKAFSSYLDSHFNESFGISEVGLKLIPEHYSKIKSRLESLDARAPALSTTQLRFTNEGMTIKGELSISGGGRSFHHKAKGESPWEIYKSLEKEVDKQLSRWKKTRFLTPNIGKLNQLAGGMSYEKIS